MKSTDDLFDTQELQAQHSFTGRDMLRILFKHKSAILICFIGVSLIVALGMYWLPPTFIAEGKILVITERQGNPSFLSGIAAYREAPQADPVNRKMETEMELLTTREISERVVRKLGITYKQVYRKPYAVLLDPVADLYDWIREHVFGIAPDPEKRGFKDTVDAFNNSLVVEPTKSKSSDTNSNVINVNLKAVDRDMAYQAVEAVMQTYIDYAAEQNLGEGEEAYKLVATQKQQAGEELQRTEQALQSFLSTQGDNMIVANGVSSSSMTSNLPSDQSPGRQSVVGTMKSRLVDMQLRLGEMRQVYKDDAENVRQLKSAIADLETRMSQEVKANAEAEVKASALERARAMAVSHFQELERKLDQIDLYLKLNGSEADTRRIVESPIKPKSSEWKKDLLIVLLGSLAGLILGLGVAGYREYSDHRIQSGDEIQRHLGVETLAVIPELSSNELAVLLKPGPAT